MKKILIPIILFLLLVVVSSGCLWQDPIVGTWEYTSSETGTIMIIELYPDQTGIMTTIFKGAGSETFETSWEKVEGYCYKIVNLSAYLSQNGKTMIANPGIEGYSLVFKKID